VIYNNEIPSKLV